MILQKEVLTSRSNAFVKWVAQLSDKKHREADRAFFVEGIKLALEAGEARLPVTHVLVAESKIEAYRAQILRAFSASCFDDTVLISVSDSVFSKISTEKAPQGVIAVIKYLDNFKFLDIIYKEDFFLERGERFIVLSSVRDPSNLGSVIRSAVAFGVEHIVISSDSADIYNPKTVRSAMGSLFKVRVSIVSDLRSFILAAREAGREIYAAELSDGAIPLSELELGSDTAVVIGNEGHGISADISEICDGSVYIPISDKTESLNASVAAAIFMWEQEKKKDE